MPKRFTFQKLLSLAFNSEVNISWHGVRCIIRRRGQYSRNIPFWLMAIVIVIVLYNHLNIPWPSFTKMYNQKEDYPCISNEFRRSELRVDLSVRLRADIARDTQKALTHLPVLFWEENRYRKMFYRNASCARFPDINDLQIYDLYWQSLSTKYFTLHLFSAYYDLRKRCSRCPAIRIIGMINSNKVLSNNTYCQIWFANISEPLIVKTTDYLNIMPSYWSGNWTYNYLYAYLITCSIPQEFNSEQPTFVSVVERACDRATNILNVTYNKLDETDKKNDFVVCVKMLDFPYSDESVRAIEWIELVQLLGASKIFIYTLNVHDNMTKVFQYYEKRGVVEVVPITLAGYEPNSVGLQHLNLRTQQKRNWIQRTLHELISLNDCFYKNIYKYEYITSQDFDEVIVPVKGYNWKDLFRELSNVTTPNTTSFQAINKIFTTICDNSIEWQEDIPNYMHMLQHVLINPVNAHPSSTKTFFKSEMVEAIHNHYARRCLGPKYCKTHRMNLEMGKLHHYRTIDLDNVGASCEDLKPHLTTDTTLWKYKEPLTDRTTAVLYDLGFLGWMDDER